MKKTFLLLTVIILISCNKYIYNEIKSNSSDNELWYHKTLGFEDFKCNLNNDNKIIVAVLDTQIDLNHETLKGKIWINKKEIPDNNIDDDNNGYIDDINGWNFVGFNNGNYYRYGNFEFTNILGNLDTFIGNNKDCNTSIDSIIKVIKYKQEDTKSYYVNWKKSIDFSINIWDKMQDSILKYFPNHEYSLNQLDSLYKKTKINDKTFKERRDTGDDDLGALISYKIVFSKMKYNSINDIEEIQKQVDSVIQRNLNPTLNIRNKIITGRKRGYGNNKLNSNKYQLDHATLVSSIIAGNGNKIKGFHNKILIMPLNISTSGDEHDDDIANAIYYAVDNGAKIINMSFGKEFSFNQKRVTDAMRYAEVHNVLIVHGSGNDGIDIDKKTYFPNDFNYCKKEVEINNFINVGSISKRIDSTMVSNFSNYGKENVDIFAPGEDIYVAFSNNKYGFDSGTSIACPMVSGTAALVWLNYPNLTVQELKKCILDSGIYIDKKVLKPKSKGEMVSLTDLCKTGRILNTKNALLMAKQISNKK